MPKPPNFYHLDNHHYKNYKPTHQIIPPIQNPYIYKHINITSNAHKSHEYHYQSLDKK